MNRSIVLDYDEYHTPLGAITLALGADEDHLLLEVELGGNEARREPRTHAPAGWEVRQVDGRPEFCSVFLCRAIKANAIYQEGCALSAALSRPLLASLCIRVAEENGITSVVHGLAGNDQLRFEMALEALAPQLEVHSVAAILGSQNDVNHGSCSVSANLWGASTEGGDLRDIASRSSHLVSPTGGTTDKPRAHVISFNEGVPVALDGRRLALQDLIVALNDAGRAIGLGSCDVVEDGSVGLKTRSLYDSPAAFMLVTAHRDLERTVATREQNRFKPVVDQAWAELVYDGQWFNEQRISLDAYIDSINQWVTGDVTLLLRPGGASVIARSSPHAIYDDRDAIYRFGQDFAIDATAAVGRARSAGMRASVRRRLSTADHARGARSLWSA